MKIEQRERVISDLLKELSRQTAAEFTGSLTLIWTSSPGLSTIGRSSRSLEPTLKVSPWCLNGITPDVVADFALRRELCYNFAEDCAEDFRPYPNIMVVGDARLPIITRSSFGVVAQALTYLWDQHVKASPQVEAVLRKVRGRGEHIPPVDQMTPALIDALCLRAMNPPYTIWLERQGGASDLSSEVTGNT